MPNDKGEYSKLPSVASIPAPELVKRKIMSLMEELDEITELKVQLIVREDSCKDALEKLQRDAGKLGFRHGILVFSSQTIAGRRTLDKMLLMENGVTAAIINASCKVGSPYVRNTFKRLEEGDESDGA